MVSRPNHESCRKYFPPRSWTKWTSFGWKEINYVPVTENKFISGRCPGLSSLDIEFPPAPSELWNDIVCCPWFYCICTVTLWHRNGNGAVCLRDRKYVLRPSYLRQSLWPETNLFRDFYLALHLFFYLVQIHLWSKIMYLFPVKTTINTSR